MPNNRSLSEINHKLLKHSHVIETTLSELLAKGTPRRVLEVGFGQGRALIELAWRFRNEPVSFFGIDKVRQPPVEGSEDLLAVARHYGITLDHELRRLPELFFYDATQLHFDAESIDLVYSVLCIRFIERKAEFLEEVCRILTPGGIALLDFGESHWNYPYGPVCDGKVLTPYRSRFVLKYGDQLVPLPEYLKAISNAVPFRFDFLGTSRCVIRVTKLRPSRLRLRLTYNEDLSVPMNTMPYRSKAGKIRGGFRTVYDVRPEIYRSLVGSALRPADDALHGKGMAESRVAAGLPQDST